MLIFQRKEVKMVLSSLDYVEMEIDNIFFDVIKPHVKKMIAKEPERIAISIHEEKLPPNVVALCLVKLVLENHLWSGQYHIYRGLLNMTGHELLAIYNKVVRALESSGCFPDGAFEGHRTDMEQGIKEVG